LKLASGKLPVIEAGAPSHLVEASRFYCMPAEAPFRCRCRLLANEI
jgi:hypothetical protein